MEEHPFRFTVRTLKAFRDAAEHVELLLRDAPRHHGSCESVAVS